MHYYLVTTFHHEAYVESTLKSIRNQYACAADFEQEARVLIVDDASSDGTPALLSRLAQSYCNVEVFLNQRNQGIGFNRNFLLNWFCSRCPNPTDFVLFVDGDDLLADGSMAAKLQVFQSDPGLDVVGGQLGVFFGNNVMDTQPVTTFPVDPEIQAIANIFECHFYVSNALFRAAVFLNRSVRFPETATSEDWLFFALYPLKKRHIPEITLKYRRHSSNLTNRLSSEADVFSLRRQAHSLGLLRLAMLPSARECELLDLIGYMSFRMVWFGDQVRYRPEIQMPWFNLLGSQPDVVTDWERLRRELAELFKRICQHNDRVRAFDPVKLHAYLSAMLEFAGQEVRCARDAEAKRSIAG